MNLKWLGSAVSAFSSNVEVLSSKIFESLSLWH